MDAAQFRAWYERRGLTQKQAAELLGVPQQRVSEMARGAAPVRPQIERLMDALDRLDECEKRARERTATRRAKRGG